ncbi:hypothetical protein HOY82DRAFT_537089 [Tuber indicum]|nr:hypothetical protein HOY82DRAFT_537089 [Tuber indicum]
MSREIVFSMSISLWQSCGSSRITKLVLMGYTDFLRKYSLPLVAFTFPFLPVAAMNGVSKRKQRRLQREREEEQRATRRMTEKFRRQQKALYVQIIKQASRQLQEDAKVAATPAHTTTTESL